MAHAAGSPGVNVLAHGIANGERRPRESRAVRGNLAKRHARLDVGHALARFKHDGIGGGTGIAALAHCAVGIHKAVGAVICALDGERLRLVARKGVTSRSRDLLEEVLTVLRDGRGVRSGEHHKAIRVARGRHDLNSAIGGRVVDAIERIHRTGQSRARIGIGLDESEAQRLHRVGDGGVLGRRIGRAVLLGGGVIGVCVLHVMALDLVQDIVLVNANRGNKLHNLGRVDDGGILYLAGRFAHGIRVGARGSKTQTGGVIGIASRSRARSVKVDHTSCVVGRSRDNHAVLVNQLEGELTVLERTTVEHLDNLGIHVADLIRIAHGRIGSTHGVTAQGEVFFIVATVGGLEIAVEGTRVALGRNGHVVGNKGAARATRPQGERGVGRKHAGRALVHRDGQVLGRVVEVVEHVAGIAVDAVGLADTNVLAVDAQISSGNVDRGSALAINVNHQTGLAGEGKPVDIDALVAAHQLLSRERHVGTTGVALIDCDGANLAFLGEL